MPWYHIFYSERGMNGCYKGVELISILISWRKFKFVSKRMGKYSISFQKIQNPFQKRKFQLISCIRENNKRRTSERRQVKSVEI